MINDYCQTSNPDIYAIGECALWNNKILVWLHQAMTWHVLLRNMYYKKNAAFAGADMSTKLKLMGVDVASVGDAHAMTPGSLSYFMPMKQRRSTKIVVNAENQTARCSAGRLCQRI